MGSMVFFLTFSALGPPLGLLAEATTTPVAMVTAGAFSLLGALLYLPALRAERSRDQESDQESVGTSAEPASGSAS